MANLQDYLAEIKKTSRKPIIKIEFLRSQDETPLIEFKSELRLDGNLNIRNRNGVRRTVSLSIDNVLKQYFPSLDTGIWVAQKFKLYMGFEINGQEFYLPQGIFVHGNPTVNRSAVRLNASDKYALLDGSMGGELDFDVIILNSTTFGNAVRILMTLSQDPKGQSVIITPALDAEPVPYDIIVESGDTIASAIEKLASAYSANVYYNEEGFLVIEADIPDSDKGSIWDFDADSEEETNYQDGSTEYKFTDVYNSCKVIGSNINGTTVIATVKNEDLLSDTSIPNLGFERILVIKDNIIYTVPFAVQRAIYELKRATNVLSQSRLVSLPLFHLDVDRVVTVKDSDINFNKKRVLLNAITIPFNNSSSMNMTVVDTFDIDL